LTDAIEAYSQALEARPNLHNARLNRSIAYSNRRQDNDLELALADADYLAKTVPNRADVFNNRALILMAMPGNDRLDKAEADLQKALELNPELVSALINRAIIHFRRGESVELWQADLAAALSLDENRPAAWNMLCWGYAVENQPDLALPNCEKAVALDPKPTYLDSRGLAHALNGDYNQAMADFQVYVDWLEKQSGQSWRTTMEQRQAWITALANHENPFTPAVLAALRGD
jgi:tetratricopeptide (TPR) repeat protein